MCDHIIARLDLIERSYRRFWRVLLASRHSPLTKSSYDHKATSVVFQTFQRDEIRVLQIERALPSSAASDASCATIESSVSVQSGKHAIELPRHDLRGQLLGLEPNKSSCFGTHQCAL